MGATRRSIFFPCCKSVETYRHGNLHQNQTNDQIDGEDNRHNGFGVLFQLVNNGIAFAHRNLVSSRSRSRGGDENG